MAGWLVFEGEGNFTLLGVTIVGIIGSVAGAMVFFALGAWFGEERVRWLIRRYGKFVFISEQDLDRAEAWFDRYGEAVIFFGRMVPLVRSLVSIPAGVSNMNLPRFTLYTAVGTGLWSFLLAYAGYVLGRNWPLVIEWVDQYEKVVIVLLALGLVAFIVYKVRTRSAVPAPPDEDVGSVAEVDVG
jgi:membrane protein DedA with SNARE-associated domain